MFDPVIFSNRLAAVVHEIRCLNKLKERAVTIWVGPAAWAFLALHAGRPSKSQIKHISQEVEAFIDKLYIAGIECVKDEHGMFAMPDEVTIVARVKTAIIEGIA